MHGTTTGLRTDSASRLGDLEQRRPEWRPWLRLLVESQRAVDEPRGRTHLAEIEPALRTVGRPVAAPLLHERAIAVDAGRLQRLVHRLASLTAAGAADDAQGAASLRGYRPSRSDAVALLQAAVRQDRAELDALAAAAGVEPGALAAVGGFAARPPLQACGRLLEEQVPRHWPHGYCPVCAGGPLLAEQRGLDRTRWARCGRCGGQWQVEWLRCVYCGEREHERLGSLVPETGGEVLKVETCDSCRGYLKSVTTLQPLAPFDLLLQDLETVELDLVALDRGYRRPQEGGVPLDVRIVARADDDRARSAGRRQ